MSNYSDDTKMKSAFISMIVCFLTINSSFAQYKSPALDVLLQNSEIIVQGTVRYRYCPEPTSVNWLMMEHCFIPLEITRILKGSPKIVVVDTMNNTTDRYLVTTTSSDTTGVIYFNHVRHKYAHPDKTSLDSGHSPNLDYNFNLGDEVIVFLNKESDLTPETKSRVPKDWIVYPLVDAFLGVIIANDYVSEYLINKVKMSTKQN